MNSFNGDGFLRAKIQYLIDRYDVRTIVETGTYHGETTLDFASMVSDVYTIEINVNYSNIAEPKFENTNITAITGSSPEKMEDIINNLYRPLLSPTLFYLDAHWQGYNPLLDELSVLAKYKLTNSVIVIHDFKVPGKDFGFDKFSDGSDYEWNLIEKHINDIYGVGNYEYSYNHKAEGAARGAIFIVPKK